MIIVHSGCHAEISFRFFPVTESEVPQCHQIVAMNPVFLIHVLLPDLQTGKGNGEIIHFKEVEQMFFAKIEQAVKAAAGFFFTSELTKSQSLVKNLIRFPPVPLAATWANR